MGFNGFMGDIDEEREQEQEAANLLRIFERNSKRTRLKNETPREDRTPLVGCSVQANFKVDS